MLERIFPNVVTLSVLTFDPPMDENKDHNGNEISSASRNGKALGEQSKLPWQLDPHSH